MKLIHDLGEIKKAYYEITQLYSGVKTIQGLKQLSDDLGLTLEINGLDASQIEHDWEVRFFRIDSYKMLSYIYFYLENEENGEEEEVVFDVWSDFEERDVITDARIDTIDKQYELYMTE